MEFNWVDYVIIAIIALSVITGIFRGFLKEVLSLIIWVGAFWLAFAFGQPLAQLIEPYLKHDTARLVLAFMAILLGVLIVGGLLNAFVCSLVNRSGLGGINRVLGAGFGGVRGVFIVATIMLVVKLAFLPEPKYTDGSYLYKQFQPMVHWIYDVIPENFKTPGKTATTSTSSTTTVDTAPKQQSTEIMPPEL